MKGSPLGKEGVVFRAVADFTYDWESWIDHRGRLVWVNPAVERVTGYSVAACLRMRNYPLGLIHPEDRPRIRAALAGAREGTSGNDVELRVIRKDGTVRWVAISWQPMVALGYRTSVREIDERKRAEEDLREAKRRAEEADRAKSEFLAVMSHEIRSPMHAISGYAQLLARTKLDREQRNFVDVILRENAALLRIVDDVLDFSALQNDRLPIHEEPFDIREVVRSVVRATRPKAQKLVVSMRVDRRTPRTLIGDGYRLRQVLLNLVDNALKFTEEGSVRISVVPEGEWLVISVTDTGPGIPPRATSQLFEMFRQLDASSSRRHSGSGLGLAISRRLCERMGGAIGVDSTVGKGSRFWFRVPLRAGREAGATEHRDEPIRAPLQVLVVDDSEIARDLAVTLLRTLGYGAHAVSSGRAAIARARRSHYDLILLDVQMPGLDGSTTARLLREVSPASMIAALTANVFARAKGDFDAVLTKPLDVRTLARLLGAQAFDESVLADLERLRGKPELAQLRRRVDHEVMAQLTLLARTRRSDRAAAAAHSVKGLMLLVGARAAARTAENVSAAAQRGVISRGSVETLRRQVTHALQVLGRRWPAD